MYLSKLEILGFKSFAQKTVIKFNDGVTSIVGPNGCGKTNIVDAIRWCLGEQKSSALRSDKMENVIFNGTANRKPMGMSEVSLTIENTKGVLPTEYTDVTITRRIFRSGESEYLLNKNLCRLKDITNLFMDTGIGANAYSVIELKMVETILSSKAEERRTMFEEAAGVNKYKLRRRLALRKLDEVKSDLTRVNDIVAEVNKNVNSLERQAKKADRYNRHIATLKEIELDLAEREFASFSKKIEKIKTTKDENLTKKAELDLDLDDLSLKLNKLKSNLDQIESELKSKRSKVNKKTEVIYSVLNDISVAEERKRSADSNIEKYSAEIAELGKRINITSDDIENAKQRIVKTTEEVDNKRSSQNEIKSKLEELRTNLDEKKSAVKRQSEQIVHKFKAVSLKENELLNIANALDGKNNQITKLNDKVLQLTNDVAKTVGFIESLNEEKDTVAKKISESEEQYSKKVAEKEKLEIKLNFLRTNELELKSLISALSEKINFIQNLVDNLEGISRGTKSLIENTSWAKGDVALLASIGSSDEDFRMAAEAALRYNVNNILITSLEDLQRGIKYLKENDLGRASFYILDRDESSRGGFLQTVERFFENRRRKNLMKDDAFVDWAENIIKTEKKWSRFFSKLVHNTAIVKDFDSAMRLSAKYSNLSFATMNGDFFDGAGIIDSGVSPEFEETLFGKKQLLDQLKNELPAKQKQLRNFSESIFSTTEKIKGIDLKVLSNQGKMLVNDLANIDKQISQFEFEKKKANDEIEKTHQLVQEYAADANKIDNEKNKISDDLDKLQSAHSSADTELRIKEEESLKTEKEFNSLIYSENETKLELERALGAVRSLDNLVIQSKNNIENLNTSIDIRQNDIGRANKAIEEIKNILNSKNSELENAKQEKDILTEELEKTEKSYLEIKSEAAKIENEQNDIRSEKDSILDSNRDLEIELNESEIKKQNLTEHISEEYGLQVELKQFDDLQTFNFTEKHNEVHDFRQKIKNLGPINLLAYSEFEEEKKRLDFLIQQRDDLVESEKDIVKTIDEINHAAHTQFLKTFDDIRENFIRVFRTLFDPGDEVDLKLEEGADPLEGKIEIIAKPKGKRPTSIELLSGGEKTLTAIALLFAIYLVKPSPFCILDEIDAPLDDANIDRFTRLIKDFSNDTQFIVVTHNKRTMESAETLYGVTMQEEGVSKIVSVRFNENVNVVA
ncbi:MAG: chromosome segregation protein SMC [Ignavibacteria bacterium]|nr:chromosome segregation protein SMC [Ignavibacteria bacterium]MBT8382083.1 chromosome segregation protein SMC [Ignavibacteria bacterium]MBT8390223.1 chromosome segregation protein SMC [Ignavibacteria bacterium]NNJ52824.1 chromosome segregation protein SMC [Ignavibacteriaceae bacterium]NNL20876.1 chromosome segregation protein SMC [Ignavibacteriaceae bacterium]